MRELDNSLGRSDADTFSFAAQVFDQCLRCIGNIRLQTIQRPVDNRVALTFELSTKDFVLQPFVDCSLVNSCVGKRFSALRFLLQAR